MAKYVPLNNQQVNDTISSWLGGQKAQISQTNAVIARNQAAGAAAATAAAGSASAKSSGGNVNQGGENFLQRAMDFLSTGDYVVGEVGHALQTEASKQEGNGGRTFAQSTPAQQKGYVQHNPFTGDTTINGKLQRDPAPQNPNDPTGLGGLFSTVGAVGGAIGRGISEGFGARYKDHAPRTPGSVLVGEEGVGSGLNAFGKGAIGFAADVALDPLNLVGVGEIKAGAKIVGGAVKGVTKVAEDGTTATVRGLAGARAGKAAYDAQVASTAARKAAVKANRSASRLDPSRTTTQAVAAETEAERAAGQANVAAATASAEPKVAASAAVKAEEAAAPQAAAQAAEEVATAPAAPIVHEASLPVEDAAKVPLSEAENAASSADVAGATTAAHDAVHGADGAAAAAAVTSGGSKVEQAANELLKTLTSKSRTVPARAILDASTTGAKPIMEAGAIPHLATALHDAKSVPEVEAAIKAAKKFPDARALLAKNTRVDGDAMTVERMFQRAAMSRLTGGSRSGGAAMRQAQSALAAAHRIPAGKLDSDQLLAAIHDFDPNLDVNSGHLLQQLHKLKPDAQEQLLKEALGERAGTQFGTFDEAIAAAVNGQVDASGMRQMLKALGIRSNATQEKTLIATMSSKGVQKWQDVLNAIPTTEEVAAEHGFDADDAAAAAATDVDAVQNAAAEAAVDAAEHAGEQLPDETGAAAQANADGLTVQPAPLKLPDGSLGQIVSKYDLVPGKVELNSQQAWRQMSGEILRSTVGLSANVKGLEGAARADFLYPKLLSKLTAGEAFLRSHGVMPAFVPHGGQSWYFSFGQIIDQLSEPTVKKAFFDLQYRLAAKGTGATEASQAAFKQGLTIFPTQFGEGTVAALRGHDADGIFQAMMRGGKRNAFSSSPEGQAALRQVAAEMATPEYKVTMQTIHDGQQIIHLAFVNRAADQIVGPLASEFIRTVATYGDRSGIVNLIAEASKAAKATVHEGQDTQLLRQLVEQHSSNGILSSLLEAEGATARADVRAGEAAGKSDVERAAAQNQVEDEFTPQPGREVPGKGEPSKGQRARDQKTRNDGAENADQFARETQDTAADMLDDLQSPANGLDDIPMENIATIGAIRQAMNWGARSGDKILTALQGTHGMAFVKPKLAERMSGTLQETQDYHSKMLTWALGAASGGAARRAGSEPGALAAQGLIKRLQDATGVPQTIDSIHAATRVWWTALAAATRADPALAGEELLAALKEGTAPGRESGLGAEGLDDVQAQMAVELHELITEVFEPRNGQLQRMQSTSKNLIAELGRHGADSSILPKGDADLADSANMWRTFTHEADGRNPLDDLLKWKGAIEAAGVGPSTADALTWAAQDIAREEGLKTVKDQLAAGWKRVDTARDDTFIVQHLKKDMLYPPEFLKQLPYAENMMKQVQDGGRFSNHPVWVKTIQYSDFATNLLKTSQTIWRPAHHIDNLLGDSLINLMRGVNPKYTLQAPKILRELGQLGDVSDNAIGELSRAVTEGGTDLPPVGNVAMTVSVRGKPVELTHAQIAAEGRRRGVFVTDKVARDFLPGSSAKGALGSDLGRKLRENKVTGAIPAVDRRIGAFSATRDNLTRTPHFLHAMGERDWNSLDEMFGAAAADVGKWHPSVQQLSTFEQKVARRLFYFYTWQRKTATLVMRTAVQRPQAVTAVSKAQFEMASAAGLNPESIGQPTPSDDPRIPTYASQGLLGPTFTAGYNPLNPGSETEQYGDAAHDWGISLSAPQIDSLQSLFQGSPFEVAFGAANPLITVPLEIGLNSQPESAVKPQDNIGQFLLNQTGTPGTLVTALTGSNGKSAPKNGTPQQLGQFDASQAGNQARVGLNYLTGLKFQDYTSLSNQRNAKLEQSANTTEQLKQQGYSDSAIATLKRLQSGR